MLKKNIPSDGFKGFKEYWKSDAVSGFLVFLIALPLCLGISKASGFPPIAGIYTAIIGGIFVSFFSGSSLSIKGPAAGLIVIALGAVEELGKGDSHLGYQLALATIVVAGVFQVLFGFLKAGVLGSFFPLSVVHGMLAAIGIIIASKQIHVLLGVIPSSKEPIELIEEIPLSISKMNPEIALIGFVSLMILVFMPFIKNKILKLIPPALVVILVAIPFGLFFKLNVIHDVNLFEHIYSFDPSKLLVKLPDSFFGGITLPDFSQITSFTSIKYIVMFALIGSIESLLTGKAVDGLDPDKRKSDLNKDLWAVGFGNIVSGMIGGLPMISEVVRSSANVNNGAKTRFANMFHGLFLFAFVLLAAPFIMMIPNAALAAMLIFTGWRLASPKEFVNAYKVGPEQFIVFIVTIGLTLYVDLLVGVFVGIITKIVIHVMMGFKLTDLFKGQFELNKQSDSAVITINGPAVFSNFLSFQKLIDSVPPKDKLTLDFSYSNYIDHSFLENIHIYEEDFFHNGGKLEIKGMENFHYLSNHPFSGRKKINNPIFKSQIINLSSRQRFINNWAISNGFDYEAKVPLTIFKVNLSSFPISRRIKDVESVILKQNDNYSLMIADLKIQEGAMMTQENYIMNLVSLSGFKNELPDFVLEKEDITDLLKRFTGFKDINFDQYPVFSKKYFLSSDNESQVRKIFAQNVIQLLENNPIYFVMCRNNQIIIHKDNNLWNTTKYDQEIAFIIELTHCFIYNNQ